MARQISLLLYLAFIVAILCRPAIADSADGSGASYLIQPGDLLEISVWKEENLERAILVRPDGGISFPLAGDMQAAGKTISEVRDVVADRLSKYIPDPVVTVSMQQLSGNKIYVIGQVQRPGEFIANRNMDVLQALSVAGGMTPYAAANKILVLRRENGILRSFPFRYGDIEKGKSLGQNIILQSGDVVLVP
jgi:polysaccharide export outer membrane protein